MSQSSDEGHTLMCITPTHVMHERVGKKKELAHLAYSIEAQARFVLV